MYEIIYRTLNDICTIRESISDYSVVIETDAKILDHTIQEYADILLSMKCLDFHFYGEDRERWHQIFDRVDSSKFDGKALTSNISDIHFLKCCKEKIYLFTRPLELRAPKIKSIPTTMDFYSFINSSDISNYLREIGYEFTSLEAAWLVYQNNNASLDQKITAWEYIISNMPDCEVPDRPNCIYRKSLHETLRKYINILIKNHDQFLADTGDAFYRCRYLWKSGWDNDDVFHTQLASALSDKEVYYEDIVKFTISKHIPKQTLPQKACYNNHGLMTDIDIRPESDEEEELNSYFLDGLWFSFPVPFKKGDIVTTSVLSGNDLFVIDDCVAWEGFHNDKLKENGDRTDMCAYGYSQEDNGTIYHECMHSYMDLEYYRGPLNADKRFLKALSNFLKGKIVLDLLLNSYTKIILDNLNNNLVNNYFSEEGLAMAGLDNNCIFFFGSKSITTLSPDFINELEIAMLNRCHILVGDCSGVDLEVQRYLADSEYKNVTVYYSFDEQHPKPRNNVGSWQQMKCNNKSSSDLSPFGFRRLKDIQMITTCSKAICLWDGKSKGTQTNIEELRRHGVQLKIY